MAAQLTTTSGPSARAAVAVQRQRDQFLARAALALDEHGERLRGGPEDLLPQVR